MCERRLRFASGECRSPAAATGRAPGNPSRPRRPGALSEDRPRPWRIASTGRRAIGGGCLGRRPPPYGPIAHRLKGRRRRRFRRVRVGLFRRRGPGETIRAIQTAKHVVFAAHGRPRRTVSCFSHRAAPPKLNWKLANHARGTQVRKRYSSTARKYAWMLSQGTSGSRTCVGQGKYPRGPSVSIVRCTVR